MRNFLEHQDRAWDRSVKLVALLVLAVAGTVAVTGLAVTYLFILLLLCSPVDPRDFQLQTLEVFLLSSVITALLVGVSSLQKLRQLRAGGRVIAEDLGGEAVDTHTLDRRQQRLLNIVGEMAIASSIPAPTVYVLPKQPGINAFAAGLTFDDAVVAVTQGCLQRLNRDQLQGVIAHEFSHILNGDMRLNMRLAGLLHGVLGITLFAEALLQTAHELSTTTKNHRDALSELFMALGLTLAGILLWPIGLIGTLFGTLVMSATSRQREFLADASAVQFTRNPEGISGALKVLFGCDAGSRVRSPKSIEASHFFFAPGCAWMSRLLATHPPLEERIRRLDPSWDGLPLYEDVDPVDQHPDGQPGRMRLAAVSAIGSPAQQLSASDGSLAHSSAAVSDDSVWSASSCDEAYDQVLGTLAPAWLELSDDAEGCQVVVLALWLIATDSDSGRNGAANLSESDCRMVQRLIDQLERLEPAQQMLLFDRAIARTGLLPLDERSEFRDRIQPLREASDPDDVAAWSIGWQVRRCLGEAPPKAARPRYAKLIQVRRACDVLLSMACHCGTSHDAMAAYAFQRAVVHLQLADAEFWTRGDLSGEHLDAALEMIGELAPRPQQQFLAAIEQCLSTDHGLTVAESLFVRGFCAALQFPVPAWLPGQLIGSNR